MTEPLPGFQTSYDLLRSEGRQFPRGFLHPTPLEGITYSETFATHPVTADRRVMAAHGTIYAESRLRPALEQHGARTASFDDFRRQLGRFMGGNRLIWGFSGFTGSGMKYRVEALVMDNILAFIRHDGAAPAAISDGAGSEGVLGLSAILAKRHRIPTIGYAPTNALAEAGPRDHLVVKFESFKDREALVAATADAIVCVGGGEGTERECHQALRLGSSALVLAPSGTHTLNLKKLKGATIRPGQLTTWAQGKTHREKLAAEQELADKLGAFLLTAHLARSYRPKRQALVGRLLAK